VELLVKSAVGFAGGKPLGSTGTKKGSRAVAKTNKNGA
jgi:hypothetical protein